MEGFETLRAIISNRRSVKSEQMNGQKISNEDIIEIIEMADWAPTHGRTEPWRFFVLTGDNLKKFGEHHAELYWANTPEETRNETKKEILSKKGDNASHLVITVMKRTEETKIIIEEEFAATAAAVENMLLAATAKGFASFWSTGGMTHHPVMKMYLGLKEDDLVTGLIYFGKTDKVKEGIRKIPIEDKIIWVS
ncbi:MAG TPA: nitroreductase [Edaphocola sp.]|nr:nitroreductase [Edaphocola sp.]